MSQSGYIALALCSLVTLLLRVLPILLMSRIRLGKTAREVGAGAGTAPGDQHALSHQRHARSTSCARACNRSA